MARLTLYLSDEELNEVERSASTNHTSISTAARHMLLVGCETLRGNVQRQAALERVQEQNDVKRLAPGQSGTPPWGAPLPASPQHVPYHDPDGGAVTMEVPEHL